MTSKTKKTLGIIALCLGWVIPLVGVILAIIGLCVKNVPEKGKPEDNIGTNLNIIALVESIVFWILWMIVYARAI